MLYYLKVTFKARLYFFTLYLKVVARYEFYILEDHVRVQNVNYYLLGFPILILANRSAS